MASDLTIEFHLPTRTIEHFKKFASICARLKPFGRVCINIADLAEKSLYEMPEGGSGWHEYASYKSSVFHFFPHPDIARHLPKDHVAANRELLLKKVKVLEELGVDAYFHAQEPYFMPESFFQEFPHLRGARVDHPPRSTREAFAWCLDQPETLEMIAYMTAELRKNVPMLTGYSAKVNDAGSGICWSDYNYPGINGPTLCQTRNVGERLKGFIEAIHKGAVQGGGDIHVNLSGNLSRRESDMLIPILPENSSFESKGRRRSKGAHVSSLITRAYPVLGMINPLEVIEAVERLTSTNAPSLTLGFADAYGRGYEPLSVVERMVDIVKELLENPVKGRIERLVYLKKLCSKWAGEKNGETLMEAFYSLNEALKYKNAGSRSFSTMYDGVSARHITRPMVLKPESLTPEEENYFLPYHFDMPKGLGRDDYLFVHGFSSPTAWTGGDWFWLPVLQQAMGTFRSVAGVMESMEDASETEWLTQFAASLRLYASFLLSSHNLYFNQVFREENREALAQEPPDQGDVYKGISFKHVGSWNETLRHEMDNTAECLRLLKNGGVDFVMHAEKPEEQDTFLLGPDIIKDIEKKRDIMLAHWRDIEAYSLVHKSVL